MGISVWAWELGGGGWGGRGGGLRGEKGVDFSEICVHIGPPVSVD